MATFEKRHRRHKHQGKRIETVLGEIIMSLLRVGSRGPQVTTLQQAINAKTSPSPGLSTDGVFGPKTRDGVMRFQRQARITADGIAGPQTQAALANARSGPAAPTPRDNAPLLRQGSRGPQVEDLQRQLNQKLSPSPNLTVDGIFGNGTKNAVVKFQGQARLTADGVVGPKTRTALKNAKPNPNAPKPDPAPVPPAGSNSEYFPFSTMTSYDWTGSYRYFGANRGNGSRAHAGCDLYYPAGTKIHAIKDGTVTKGPYAFYAQTYAMEVDHGDFYVRYGEIQADTPVQAGSTVTAGQHIAQVGHLVGISVPSDMLHLEMYSGAGAGDLTDRSSRSAKRADGVSFQRRSDLIDPSSYLARWKSNLAPA
jgi:peptidoglycan hydrolase-like protein with peptidoglycan-binding domain